MESREIMTSGQAQMVTSQAAVKPITEAISASKAHLHKPKGSQGRKGRQKPKLRTQRMVLPGRPSASMSRLKTHQGEPRGAALQSTFGTEGINCRKV